MPPTQRAVLVLRDVLGYRAAEVAEMLDTTRGRRSNSALQRARAAVDALPAATATARPLPRSRASASCVGRFADAFEGGDVDAVVALLTDDAVADHAAGAARVPGPGGDRRVPLDRAAGGRLERFRLVPTRANGQPAFGFYITDPQCPVARAVGVMVLTLEGDRVAAITAFHDTGVFPYFGLPRTLRDV